MQMERAAFLPKLKMKGTPYQAARRTRPMLSTAFGVGLEPLLCSSPAAASGPVRPLAAARVVLPPASNEWSAIAGQSGQTLLLPTPSSSALFLHSAFETRTPTRPVLRTFHKSPPVATENMGHRHLHQADPDADPELALGPNPDLNPTSDATHTPNPSRSYLLEAYETLRMIDENGSASVSGLADVSIRIISPAPALPACALTSAFYRKPLNDVHEVRPIPTPQFTADCYPPEAVVPDVSGTSRVLCQSKRTREPSPNELCTPKRLLTEAEAASRSLTHLYPSFSALHDSTVSAAQLQQSAAATKRSGTFEDCTGLGLDSRPKTEAQTTAPTRVRSHSRSRTRILTNPRCRRRTSSRHAIGRSGAAAAISLSHIHAFSGPAKMKTAAATAKRAAAAGGAIGTRFRRRRSAKGSGRSGERSRSRDREGHAPPDRSGDLRCRSSSNRAIPSAELATGYNGHEFGCASDCMSPRK